MLLTNAKAMTDVAIMQKLTGQKEARELQLKSVLKEEENMPRWNFTKVTQLTQWIEVQVYSLCGMANQGKGEYPKERRDSRFYGGLSF